MLRRQPLKVISASASILVDERSHLLAATTFPYPSEKAIGTQILPIPRERRAGKFPMRATTSSREKSDWISRNCVSMKRKKMQNGDCGLSCCLTCPIIDIYYTHDVYSGVGSDNLVGAADDNNILTLNGLGFNQNDELHNDVNAFHNDVINDVKLIE